MKLRKKMYICNRLVIFYMNIIKSQGNFSIIQEDIYFYIVKNNRFINTPKGSIVRTQFFDIAEAILNEYINIGVNDAYWNPTTTTNFHYSFIDYFINMKQNEASIMLKNKSWANEWTLMQCKSGNISYTQKWEIIFGESNKRKEQINNWLDKCSCIQLCAISCVYNYYNSMNIPFIMSKIIDENNINEEAFLKIVTAFINECDPTFNINLFNQMFKQFKFYYLIELNR